MAGDFNALLDHKRDTTNKNPPKPAISRSFQFNSFIQSVGAQDVARIFYPEVTKFTHFNDPPFHSSSRIDYIFTNEGLLNFILDIKVGFAYKTDHCPVYVTIQSGRNPPGRGYWKFPEFLVKDAEFKSFLKGNIDE